jgi:uncharacterized protein (DUF885 family)
VDAETAALQSFLGEFERFDASSLGRPARADREMVLAHIRARLLDLESVRGWERNPDLYAAGLSNSIFLVMSRNFAPPEARLRSVIARESGFPAVLAAARENLKNPPRIYTEIALEQMPGIIAFFQKDVPEAFRSVKDSRLNARFRAANSAAVAALEQHRDWMKTHLLPRSRGDFRLGAGLLSRKLLYEEMVSTRLDDLLRTGLEDLRRNQRRLEAAAAKIDSKRSARDVFTTLENDYPPPAKLLGEFRRVLRSLRDFIERKGICTLPSPLLPAVEETPPFARALTMASMDTPGAYESTAKEAFFNITLPEKDWPPDRVAGHMAGFNRGTILSTAIHEAYPGHYTQFLWVQRAPSKVRKLLGCGSNAEGWAHYAEQMMLDEGYGGGDPRLRIGQLQDALLRDARLIAGIEMHTGRMTFEQSIEFFVREGYQSRANAERETKRGTSDPTYLIYTLGKLQILELREEIQEKLGAKFSLRAFHDGFLREGYPPVRIVREALLP